MSTKQSNGSVAVGTGIAVGMLCLFVAQIFGGPMTLVGMLGFFAAATALVLYAKRTAVAARIGAVTGGISIAFSTLCFFIFPAFTPAFILALLFGAVSGGIALSLKAKRTGLVAFAFALTPPGFHLAIDFAPEPFHNTYVVFAVLAVAIVVAVLALVDYSRARRVTGSVAL